MSVNIPQECPECGTRLDASEVNQQEINGRIVLSCKNCGERLPTGEQRVNYKSPVVEEDDG